MLKKLTVTPHKYLRKISIVLLALGVMFNIIQLLIQTSRGTQDWLPLLSMILFIVYLRNYETVNSKTLLVVTFIPMAMRDFLIAFDNWQSIQNILVEMLSKPTWDFYVECGIYYIIFHVICAICALFLSFDSFIDFKFCKISRIFACIVALYPINDLCGHLFSRYIYTSRYFIWLPLSIVMVVWHIVVILFWLFAAKPKIDTKEQLIKLKTQYEAGVITEEEYNKEREEILNTL